MRKLLEYKATILLLAVAGLVGLGLLAAALREFQFRPASPLPFSFSLTAPGVGAGEARFPLLTFLVIVAVALVILALIVAIFNPAARKRLLLSLLRFGLTLLAVWLLMDVADLRVKMTEAMMAAPPPAVVDVSGFAAGETPVFEPPQVSSNMVFLISFGLALGMVLLGWFIYTRRPKGGRHSAKEELAGIARQALSGLQDGQDWDEAIVQAYVRMNEVVTAERGLIRQLGTTPAEFALRMERAGLPGEAVRTLTRLFEQVRYGGRKSDAQERDLAAAALNAILRACGVNP